MEWFVGLYPPPVGTLVAQFHTVVTAKVFIQLVLQELETSSQLLFVFNRHLAADFGLLLAKEGKKPVDVLSLFLDLPHRAFEIELARDGALHIVIGRVPYQRVPGTD